MAWTLPDIPVTSTVATVANWGAKVWNCLKFLKGLSGTVVLEDGLDLGANEFTVNSVEIVGADGEVNKIAVEDHTHQNAANCGTLDHGLALTGLTDDDHPQYIKHSLADAANDFLVASGGDNFAKKTLAETKTILGVLLGTAIVRKTADQSVINSTTLVDDTHLKFAVAASEVWEVFLRLIRFQDTGATKNTKFAFTVPTNGSFGWNDVGDIGNLTSTVGLIQKTTGTNTIYFAGNAIRICYIWGLYVGGDTAGYLQLQWAQETSENYNHTMTTNSFLIAHKIA